MLASARHSSSSNIIQAVDGESAMTHRRHQVDIQDLHGCQRHVIKAHYKCPEDGSSLGKVDWQVEQQNLTQVVPHTPAGVDKASSSSIL